MGVNPILINILNSEGTKIRTEKITVNVQDCMVFQFSEDKSYEICEGELQWGPKAMDLTEAEYDRLMALAKADGNDGNITEKDFTKANGGKVPKEYTLIEGDYNDDHHFLIRDEQHNIFQVYEAGQ